MKIRHFLYNAFLVEDKETKIAIDPGKNLWLFKLDSLIPKSEWEGITHVLVTHWDPDHFPYAIPIAKKTGAKVVCGENLMKDFFSKKVEDVHKLNVGGVVNFGDLKIEGLKTIHGPLTVKLFLGLIDMKNVIIEHYQGGQEVFLGPIRVQKIEKAMPVYDHGTIKLLFGLMRFERDNVGFARGSIGFKITIGDKTVVNLGDTMLQQEWAGLKPDVLMIPIGGRIAKNTMNEDEALEAVRLISPKLVIPCHYNNAFLWKRNLSPADDRYFKKKVENMGIKCRIMDYGDEIVF